MPDLLPSNQRTIPLSARKDIHAHQATYLGQTCWVIKDPVKLNYFRLEPEQYEILQLLDGIRNIDEVHECFQKTFPTVRRTRSQIQQVVLDLYQKGLAWSTRSGQGESMNQRGEDQKWQKLKQKLRSILFIRLPGFDPTWTLGTGYWLAKWVFHPGVIMWAATIIIYSWILILTHAAEFAQRLPPIESLTTWDCTFKLWLIIGTTKIIHELGHAFACRHSGSECHEIGMAFLVFSPCLYCDVSDSWTLESKWKRIGVALAGVYVELLIASLAFFGWWNSQPGAFHQICFLTFAVSSISTLLFNLNPLLRLDGYYILSDWLEIPNLRQKSDKALENAILWMGFGIDVESENLPAKTKLFFIVYSICSTIYRSFLVVVICWILYTSLKPYRLEFLGLFVGMLSGVLGTSTWCKRIHSSSKRHRNQTAGNPTKVGRKLQLIVGAAVLIGIAGVILFVPMPISVKSPLHLEYANAQRIYAGSDGQLAAIHIRPGQSVEAGDVLLELFSFSDIERLNQLLTQKEIQEVELRKQKVLVDTKKTAIETENLRSIESELANHLDWLEKLHVRAPIGGAIIQPPAKKPTQRNKRRLSVWDGTPIDPVNVGCQLAKGTHLLTVAPRNEFQAVLIISQLDVHSVQSGQKVRIKLNHLPNQSFDGIVERVSRATIDATEREPGSIQDPNIASVNNYHAIVRLDGDQSLFLPGIQGKAKVTIESQTAAQWIWRNVKSTFNFQI